MNTTLPKFNEPQRAAAFSWLLFIPIIAFTFIVLNFIAPYLIHEPDLAQVRDYFLSSSVGACLPKPLEQLRYVLAISLVPLLFLLLVGSYKITLEKKNSVFPNSIQGKWKWLTSDRSLIFVAFALQFILFLVVKFFWHYENRNNFRYFSTLNWKLTGWIAGVVLATYWFYLLGWVSIPRLVRRIRFHPWIIHSIVLIFTLLCLSTAVFHDGNISLADGSVQAHIGHPYGEFSAILSGKTSLVDFFPQYQNILAYLGSVYFILFGFNTLTFTLLMSFFSLLGLLSLYGVLKRVTGSPFWGGLLYLPMLAISFYTTNPSNPANAFNYYAVWPLRTFLPCVCAYLLSGTLLKQTPLRVFFLFLVGTLAAINNLDFGIPALVGCLAALGLLYFEDLKIHFKSLFKMLGVFCGAVICGLSLFVGFTYFRSGGHFPRFLEIVSFQKIFAIYGFNMLPAPRFGLYWIICSTYLAAFLLAIYRMIFTLPSMTLPNRRQEEKLHIGILVFSAVFGCGSLTYYMGRSHPYVLIAAFAPWAFCTMVLLWTSLSPAIKNRTAQTSGFSIEKLLLIVPSIILVGHYGLFFSMIFAQKVPSPKAQWRRFHQSDSSTLVRKEKLFRFVKRHTQPNEVVSLLFFEGPEFARTLKIMNLYPYPNPYSMILKAQVKGVVEEASRQQAKFLRVSFLNEVMPELPDELKAHHYRKVASEDVSSNDRIELWVPTIPLESAEDRI